MSEAPRTVSRFEILAELGRGTMGVVYRAHDPVLGRDVALKVIRPAGFGGEEDAVDFEKRFLQEARSAASLSHPGIVVVHDVGRDPATGCPYMALELLRGRPLDAVLRGKGPLPWREALRLGQKLAEALFEAHSKGIVHRDIKPANVMVLESGDPKIMDFGIAKVEASALTAAGQLFGTPLYMSPEQALGHPVDARSDLFSLGSVLYEMLTGRRAFAAESVPRILLAVTMSDPDPPSTVVGGLPPQVDRILARCLAKTPDERYPDARALARDIGDVLGSRIEAAAPAPAPADAIATRVAARPPAPSIPTPTVPPPAAAPPRRLWVPALAVVLVLAGIGAAFLAREVLRPAAAPVPAADTSPPSTAPSAVPTAAPTATPESLIARAIERVTSGLGEPAHLTIDFEHSLKSGRLKVWVDDEPVMDERIDGRVSKDIAGFKLRKGRKSDTLDIAPGRHVVRVDVEWEGSAKTQSITGNFEAGKTLRLEARLGSLGGLRRNLSLEWR
jgi:eukaryotic-like serine/threonine-protein kinase